MSKREILYKRPKTTPKTTIKKEKPVENQEERPFTAEDVKQYVLSHPHFKYAAMCKEVGVHVGNFHTWVLKADKPRVHEAVLPKMRQILEKYGYVHN